MTQPRSIRRHVGHLAVVVRNEAGALDPHCREPGFLMPLRLRYEIAITTGHTAGKNAISHKTDF